MDIGVRLIVSLVDRATAGVRGLSQRLGALGDRAGVGRVAAAFANTTTAAAALGATAARTSGRLALLGGGAGLVFKNQFVDLAAEFERYRAVLTALEGSNEAAEKAMAWVSEFAAKTPLEIDGVMEAYTKLKAFGLDPMAGTLQALTDANAKLGGNQASLEGIALAVGQAWAKQKLQGEEILQLVERGIPVWDLLAKVTGKEGEALQKLVSDGKVGRAEMAKLVEEMGRWGDGAALQQSKTWEGMVSNLLDQWMRFRLAVMQSGVFDWLKEKLSGLLAAVDEMAANGQLKQWAQETGEAILNGFRTAWEAGKGLWEVLKGIGSGLARLAEQVGGWTPVMAGIAAIMGGPLLLAVANLGLALSSLGVALLATPIGWFLITVAAIAAAVVDWNSETSYLRQTWESLVGWLSSIDLGAVGSAIIESLTAAVKAGWNNLVGWLQGAIASLTSMIPSWVGGLFGSQKLVGAPHVTGEPIKPIAAPATGGKGAEVSGRVKVEVEDARTRVTKVESKGGLGLDAAYTGQAMAH